MCKIIYIISIIIIIIINVNKALNSKVIDDDDNDDDYGLKQFHKELEEMESMYDNDIDNVLKKYNEYQDNDKNKVDTSEEHWNKVSDTFEAENDAEFLSLETSNMIEMVNGQDYYVRFDKNISDTIKEQSNSFCLPLIKSEQLHQGGPAINGGWDWMMSLNENNEKTTPSLFKNNKRQCDFDVIDASNITSSELKSRYLDTMTPVLIINGMNEQWINQFRKSVLVDELGSIQVAYGHKPPYHMNKMKLNKFINKFMEITNSPDITDNFIYPPYVWDEIGEMKEEYEKTVQIPPSAFSIMKKLPKLFEDEFGDSVNYFTMGPPCSGSHVHQHSASLNVLAFGLKRWTIFPSIQSSYLVSNKYQENIPNVLNDENMIYHPLDWFHQILPKLKVSYPKEMLECYQMAGDILYVPNYWFHTVLNIHSSLAMSFERQHTATEVAIDAFLHIDTNHDGKATHDEFISFIHNKNQNLIVLPPDDEENQKLDIMLKNKELDDIIQLAWNKLSDNTQSFDMSQCIKNWDEASHLVDQHIFPTTLHEDDI